MVGEYQYAQSAADVHIHTQWQAPAAALVTAVYHRASGDSERAVKTTSYVVRLVKLCQEPECLNDINSALSGGVVKCSPGGSAHHSGLPVLGKRSASRTATRLVHPNYVFFDLEVGVTSAIAAGFHQRLNIYLPVFKTYFVQQMLNPQSKFFSPGVISPSITSLSTDCGAQSIANYRLCSHQSPNTLEKSLSAVHRSSCCLDAANPQLATIPHLVPPGPFTHQSHTLAV